MGVKMKAGYEMTRLSIARCTIKIFWWERNLFIMIDGIWDSFNPLTPVPPVTARDEPWPFFHF